MFLLIPCFILDIFIEWPTIPKVIIVLRAMDVCTPQGANTSTSYGDQMNRTQIDTINNNIRTVDTFERVHKRFFNGYTKQLIFFLYGCS
jgi:hypothetical protein